MDVLVFVLKKSCFDYSAYGIHNFGHVHSTREMRLWVMSYRKDRANVLPFIYDRTAISENILEHVCHFLVLNEFKFEGCRLIAF